MTNDHRIGNAPIQPEYIEKMNNMAAMIDRYFNGKKTGMEREVGFVMMIFPFDDRSGRCNYVSNADKADVIRMMKYQIKKFRRQDEPDSSR
jgi:hypothetical protein